MEKRDLYDKDRNLTGESIFKGEAIPEGKYIIVVLVMIQNSKGEFLIQKRSKRKDGKYAATGGHVKTGQTSVEGMIDEIQEEIGVSVSKEELECIYSQRFDEAQVFFDLYYMKKDLNISDMVLQEEEVELVQWNTPEEIDELIKKDMFLINHAEEVYRTIDILNSRKIKGDNMKIILASKSPRRKELMDKLGVDYEIIVSEAEEILEEGLSLEEQSKKLGYIKAKAVFDKTSGDRIVIGSDTLVVKDEKLFGKPQDKQDAINMINILKNDKHQVITSIAMLVEKDGQYEEYIDCDITDVYVSDMSEKEIEDWVDTGKAYDKAGAYAMQLEFAKFIDKIDGNYYTVIGFPINKVYQQLKKFKAID